MGRVNAEWKKDEERLPVAVACEVLGTDPEAYQAYIEEGVIAELERYPGLSEVNARRNVVNGMLRSLDSIVTDKVLANDDDRFGIAHAGMRVWLRVGKAIQAEIGR